MIDTPAVTPAPLAPRPLVEPDHRALAQATPTKRGENGETQLAAMNAAHKQLLQAWVNTLRIDQDSLNKARKDNFLWRGELLRIANDQSEIGERPTLTKTEQQDRVWSLQAEAVRVTRIHVHVIAITSWLHAEISVIERELRDGSIIEEKEADIDAAVGRLLDTETRLLDDLNTTERIAKQLSYSLDATIKNLLDVMRNDRVLSRNYVPSGDGEFVGKATQDNPPSAE